MAIVGWVAIAVVAIIVLAGIVIGLGSIPDARRYMRMRRM
ncbi:DUF6893 family small protein [Mycobacterium sp.]